MKKEHYLEWEKIQEEKDIVEKSFLSDEEKKL